MGLASARRWSVARRAGIVAVCAVIAAVALIVAPSRGPASTVRVLDTLARLEGAALEAFTAHPDKLLELTNADAERFRSGWYALPASERRGLERVVPAFVGNADGLPYALRDRANRRQLATELASAEHDVRTHPADRGAAVRASSYVAIRNALRSSGASAATWSSSSRARSRPRRSRSATQTPPTSSPGPCRGWGRTRRTCSSGRWPRRTSGTRRAKRAHRRTVR